MLEHSYRVSLDPAWNENDLIDHPINLHVDTWRCSFVHAAYATCLFVSR